MKITSVLSTAFLFLIATHVTGCASGPTKAERFQQWSSSLPVGFKKQIEVARAGQVVYHAISDTPIKELQTDAGARRIGNLVTAARDKYRSWKSYGNYRVARSPTGAGIDYGDGMKYRRGDKGHKDDIIENLFDVATLNLLDTDRPSTGGCIASSRGKVIFAGAWDRECDWTLAPPFDDILIGDRMEDIESLIGRIKR